MLSHRRKIAAVTTDETDRPVPAGEGAAASKPRIDPITRLLVLRLKEAEPDRSSASIADALGNISEASVRRLLSNHATDAKHLTQALMVMAAPDRLEDWERASAVGAEDGNHKPARDYLIAAGLIEDTSNTTVNLGFQVVVAPSPGTPTYALPEPQPPITTQVLTTTDTQRQSSATPARKPSRLRR